MFLSSNVVFLRKQYTELKYSTLFRTVNFPPFEIDNTGTCRCMMGKFTFTCIHWLIYARSIDFENMRWPHSSKTSGKQKSGKLANHKKVGVRLKGGGGRRIPITSMFAINSASTPTPPPRLS